MITIPRPRRIEFRLNESEYKALLLKSHIKDMSISDYLRYLISRDKPKEKSS